MTFKKAKKLSILKWKYIYKNKGKLRGLLKVLPCLKKINSECGFCEFYEGYCSVCILKDDGKICIERGHPYEEWYLVSDLSGNYDETLATKAAKRVLELIERKVKEYE